jgi:hypothetical protein
VRLVELLAFQEAPRDGQGGRFERSAGTAGQVSEPPVVAAAVGGSA